MTPLDNDAEMQLLRDALDVLEPKLPQAWTVELMPFSDGSSDTLLHLKAGSTSNAMIIEPRLTLTPQEIERSFGAPSFRRLRAQGGRPMIVIAPYLSPRSRELLTKEEICYLDLTGNIRIVLDYPPVWFQAEGASRDPSSKKRPTRGVRGAAAGKLVRLLIDVRPSYGVTELGRAARVDPGYVTRVLDTLEAEAVLERGRRGRVVSTDWESLLRRRAEAVDLLNARHTSLYVAPGDPTRTLGRLQTLEPKEFLVTGSLSASRIAPVSAPALLVLYTLGKREEITEALDLHAVSDGANVALVRPENTAPFLNAVTSDDLMFAAPSQTAIDCLSGNGRMPAEGEAVVAWMRENEPEWRAATLDRVSWPPWMDR